MSLAPVSAQAPQAAAKELIGVWRATAAVREGLPATDVIGHQLTFAEQRFEIQSKDGKRLYSGTFRTNPRATPQTIDFAHAGSAGKAMTWLGIYRLDGDTLTICDNAPNPDKGRPSAFETSSGSGYVVITFTRVKR